jgi:hypothetical protein
MDNKSSSIKPSNNKNPAIQQLVFVLRRDGTLNAKLGLPTNDIHHQPQQNHCDLSWERAVSLLRAVAPGAMPPGPLALVISHPCVGGSLRPACAPAGPVARWRWARLLVKFLCK